MIHLTLHEREVVRTLARLSALLASFVFAGLTVTLGPPASPEGPAIERNIQYVFVGVGILATILAWRHSLPGGLLLVLSGIVLGVFAAGRYSEVTSLVVALLYVVPGVVFLVHWSGHRAIWVQAPLVLLVLSLMTYGGLQARDQHQRAFGPAHPQSALQVQPYDRIEWMWSGGVTSSSARVNARVIDDDANQARLVVSEDASLSEPLFSETVRVDEERNGAVSLEITGLRPDTTYYYAIEVDGELEQVRTGSFQTFPEESSTFSILVSSCARTGSNGLVFEAMAAEDALLYIITGDLHYENILESDVGAFRSAYAAQLTAPAQALLYQQTPVVYTWDDHDFGGNNSNAFSAAAPAARIAYREIVPHYPFPAVAGNVGIYHSFTAGGVHFIVTDTRSMRDRERMADGSHSLLGEEQREWMKQELLAGSRDHKLVVLVSAVPWIAPADNARDDWGGYATERAEIANFIADNGITNMMLLAGDAHMLAIDNGTNTDYSESGGAGFPLMQAAALDRPGSEKGGPYSEGAFPGGGQYGLVTFDDTGDGMTVTLSGRNWLREEIVRYRFEVPTPAH